MSQCDPVRNVEKLSISIDKAEILNKPIWFFTDQAET